MRITKAFLVLTLAAGSLAAQTNTPGAPKTNTNAVAAPALSAARPVQAVPREDFMPVATAAPHIALLKQIKDQAAKDAALSLGINELGAQSSQLEPTGQYVERYVRIPAGALGEEPKIIRCYVPVYRVRSSR